MNKTLITLLTGVAIGVLFAPRKGSETRKQLRQKLDDLKSSLTTEANELYALGEGLDIPEMENNYQSAGLSTSGV